MKRAKTSTSAKKRPEYQKVVDEKGQLVRGLWLRDGTFYAQMNASGQKQQYKYRLHDAQTCTPGNYRDASPERQTKEGLNLGPAREDEATGVTYEI